MPDPQDLSADKLGRLDTVGEWLLEGWAAFLLPPFLLSPFEFNKCYDHCQVLVRETGPRGTATLASLRKYMTRYLQRKWKVCCFTFPSQTSFVFSCIYFYDSVGTSLT